MTSIKRDSVQNLLGYCDFHFHFASWERYFTCIANLLKSEIGFLYVYFVVFTVAFVGICVIAAV